MRGSRVPAGPRGPRPSVARLAVVAGLGASLASLGLVAGRGPVLADLSRPDIVVIYTDDFPQHTTQLWSEPERTPSLARFAQEGTWFSRATGSTPICCPGRAGTLTGQWSHHHGVLSNDMGPYDPTDTIATRLSGAGYHAIYAGKFLNRFARYAPASADVERYAAGWADFDVLWSNQGRYYDYRVWSRDGVRDHGDRPGDHSTEVITGHATRRIREAPTDRPLLAFVALVDGHRPYLPMPRFAGDAACDAVAPWSDGSYDEADVSDKPAYVREAPPLEADAHDLRTRCEAMLGVDWAMHQLLEAVDARGRADDTLFVFTVDNGVLVGDHGLEGKVYPYATPVPMYVLWPTRWGGAPRVIDDPVSNVDLAPTFCALGGCELPAADGVSLVPLLDGEVERLERPFVYEENLLIRPRKPAWYGLRTTSAWSEDATWVYTEYSTGEVELYDLDADPWQLENLAADPAHAGTLETLESLLHDRVVEPDGVRFVAGGADDED